MKLLLAEDDLRLGRLVRHMLEKEGHQVTWVHEGQEAYQEAMVGEFDLLILDWMLPKMSGIEVLHRLREEGFQGGVLMLTAKDEVEDRVKGLNTGADDYLVKPFEFPELFARIRALGRRSFTPFKEDQVKAGNLLLNTVTRTLIREGREIPLTLREFQLMELFMRNPGQVLPRELIWDRIWGYDADVTSNILDATVKLLRKKIEDPDGKRIIHSIRGIGYKLEV
ncbi:Transcriptional regulatory protein pcoR [[Clostridium] ultunense Esp]|uniref:response regulator transcription factor n=1 Tax=Thermicanus aegyptius TaxID=94009 RepID=UPI0002B6F7E4|nr:response regulator transcription factor [Thermicanus aegyptius]CCQ97170.1 Transcriptional regulatory protein pcoR [[Clostridium] ultunense Esp]